MRSIKLIKIFWPSKPHGHIRGKPQKVDLKTGKIYNIHTKEVVGKLSKKGLSKILKALARLGIVTGIIVELLWEPAIAK